MWNFRRLKLWCSAMAVTGATDEYQISQMVHGQRPVGVLPKNSITDGSYGMRSLIDWIVSSEITGDVYESALYTIISKATTDEVDREALISAVWNRFYKEAKESNRINVFRKEVNPVWRG